eukprot:TRINITY_DN4248_c1_g1_i4.p1 TRINITY_DN4248_c1_g1~~TRINITY_DN4248_c1_g1_i4.p1  ORF type:complete len:980 (+),score=139.46 TRINITY_DN4248_c1_g1_i4:168-3107(+)
MVRILVFIAAMLRLNAVSSAETDPRYLHALLDELAEDTKKGACDGPGESTNFIQRNVQDHRSHTRRKPLGTRTGAEGVQQSPLSMDDGKDRLKGASGTSISIQQQEQQQKEQQKPEEKANQHKQQQPNKKKKKKKKKKRQSESVTSQLTLMDASRDSHQNIMNFSTSRATMDTSYSNNNAKMDCTFPDMTPQTFTATADLVSLRHFLDHFRCPLIYNVDLHKMLADAVARGGTVKQTIIPGDVDRPELVDQGVMNINPAARAATFAKDYYYIDMHHAWSTLTLASTLHRLPLMKQFDGDSDVFCRKLLYREPDDSGNFTDHCKRVFYDAWYGSQSSRKLELNSICPTCSHDEAASVKALLSNLAEEGQGYYRDLYRSGDPLVKKVVSKTGCVPSTVQNCSLQVFAGTVEWQAVSRVICEMKNYGWTVSGYLDDGVLVDKASVGSASGEDVAKFANEAAFKAGYHTKFRNKDWAEEYARTSRCVSLTGFFSRFPPAVWTLLFRSWFLVHIALGLVVFAGVMLISWHRGASASPDPEEAPEADLARFRNTSRSNEAPEEQQIAAERRTVLKIVIATQFMIQLNGNSMTPIAHRIASQSGASVSSSGLLLGIHCLGGIFSLALFYYIMRRSVRVALLLSICFLIGGSILCIAGQSLFNSFALVVVSRFVMGMELGTGLVTNFLVISISPSDVRTHNVFMADMGSCAGASFGLYLPQFITHMRNVTNNFGLTMETSVPAYLGVMGLLLGYVIYRHMPAQPELYDLFCDKKSSADPTRPELKTIAKPLKNLMSEANTAMCITALGMIVLQFRFAQAMIVLVLPVEYALSTESASSVMGVMSALSTVILTTVGGSGVLKGDGKQMQIARTTIWMQICGALMLVKFYGTDSMVAAWWLVGAFYLSVSCMGVTRWNVLKSLMTIESALPNEDILAYQRIITLGIGLIAPMISRAVAEVEVAQNILPIFVITSLIVQQIICSLLLRGR